MGCALILGFELVFAAIAVILSVLSFLTLRAIRHLGVGKPFWIPVSASSILFLLGSALTILLEIGIPLPRQTIEAAQIMRILALALVACGIYSYSRRVRGSLAEEFTIPERLFAERRKVEPLAEAPVEPEPPTIAERIRASRITQEPEPETTLECPHHVGYLQSLPKHVAIPDECLGCDRVIECRHSFVKPTELPPSTG